MIYKVLKNIVATEQTRGMLYKVVAHTVIRFGSESWVVMGVMLKVLEGFHHRVSRRISGMTVQREEGREWDYPPVADAM